MISLRLTILLVAISMAIAFVPTKTVLKSDKLMEMTLNAKTAVKSISAALIASSVLSMPVFATEGAGAKLSFFGGEDYSSPFTINEDREDPIYSPYSPYGNSEKALYKKGNNEDVAFYKGIFANSMYFLLSF